MSFRAPVANSVRWRFVGSEARLSQPVPEIVPPEIHRLMDVPNARQFQPFPFGDLEPPMQFLDSLVRERVQQPLQVVLNSEIEGTFGVTDHEAEVVSPRTFYPNDLPDERLSTFLLEPEGGEIPNRLRDKVLVRQPGPQMQPDLESAVRANPRPGEWKPPSGPTLWALRAARPGCSKNGSAGFH